MLESLSDGEIVETLGEADLQPEDTLFPLAFTTSFVISDEEEGEEEDGLRLRLLVVALELSFAFANLPSTT